MGACARRARLVGAAAFAWTLVAFPPAVVAGAWTEPQGEGLMIETLWGWTGEGAPWGGDGEPAAAVGRVVVPEETSVFTVKLPSTLVARVPARAP